ncbi:Pancreatic lipase-related protein 2 [Folsomia candida]|uniref:Pancreatic lipase-related protein 2 n=1 Tax=Folsomia candida TaxID=158441 RepID=A0A226E3K7_FOLCA|nr:Pancreatic lipase-related protein 2 [Folsomia candida]
MRYASFSTSVFLILVYFSGCITSQANWWLNCVGTNPGPSNVFFYLYTRDNPNQEQRLTLGNTESIKNSNFDPSYPVVFYIHGFKDWSDGTSSQAIKDEYVKNSNFYNFILVDWCKVVKPSSPTDIPMGFTCNANGIICPGGGGDPYRSASCDALAVGEYVARMVKFLVDNGFADLTRIHLIGHSLGAHLSGVAGYHVKALTGQKVARVTGLDPALPLFGDANLPLAQRLDPTDADFVDVIHTAGADGTSEICASLGFLEPLAGCLQSLKSSPNNISKSDVELDIVVIPSGHTDVLQTAINFIDPVREFPRASITFLDQRNMVNLVSAARPFSIHHRCPGVTGGEYPQTTCNTREFYETTPAQRNTFGHEVFTKGHLTPLRPFQFAKAAMDSTSYCTNIAPQDPRTNHPAWCNVEKRVFDHAAREDTGHPGYVITGTCGNPSTEEITNRGAFIPACWWKVYCYKKDGKVTAVGFKTSNNMIKVGDNAATEVRKREAATPLSQWAIGEDDVIHKSWAHLSVEDIQTRLLQGHYPSSNLPTPGECQDAILTPAEAQYWKDQFGLSSTSRSGRESNDECYFCSPGDDCYVENTLEPCASGKDIVFAVVRKIFNSAVFDPDYQYLYRLANVLNRFGLEGTSCRPGGIWQIQESWFQETKSGITPALKDAIYTKFEIDWSTTVWEDLQKPMYSGLAARILMQLRRRDMQPTIRLQGETLFATTYSPRLASEFIGKTDQYYKEDKIRGRYDMILVLDGSGSIGPADFERARTAVAELLGPFAETQVRVGLITFSTAVTTNFQLDNRYTENEMRNAIRSIPYPGGGTNTHLGINEAINMFDRHVLDPKVPSVSIVLTDGQSSSPASTVTASAAAKARGIYTFAVGIGSGIRQAELEIIAGDNPRHVFSLGSFDALQEIPLWLNIETQTIAIVRPDNDNFSDAVKSEERRYFKYPLPTEGLTVEVFNSLGETATYFAYEFDAPSSAINNGKIENGCGFVGERGTTFNTQPVFETALENEVIFSRDLYLGPLSRSLSTLDRDYLRQSMDGNRFQLLAKARFSSYVTEKRQLVMNADYEEENARLYTGTNNSLIEVRPVRTWTAPYPVSYKYNLELYFTEEPQPGILPVKVYVHDGVQQAQIDITIEVV